MSLANIRSICDAITQYAPKLETGDWPSTQVRTMLRQLAAEAGMASAAIDRAHMNELIGLYQVGRKDASAAARVAMRVQQRADAMALLGIFDDPATATNAAPEPFEDGASRKPGFDPLAPLPVPAGPSLDVIRQIIEEEIKDGALQPLEAALQQFDKDVRADFAGYLSSNRDTILDDVRGALRDIAAEVLRDLTPTRLDVVMPSSEPKSLGLVHRDTPKLIAMLAAGVNAYLHGPAGSGKTTAAHKVAEAFGVEFYFAAKVESEYQLMGFKDAKGDTVRTQFREAYEKGGVFLFDEMDASSPSAVVALNAALANGICPFPDAIVKRHEQFYCIGAGNTMLTGATRAYAGRSQLDAASIDRFAFLHWGYDNDLEAALATDNVWCRYVQAVRAAVADRGITHLVTPRATYDGCKLLKAGMDWDTVAGMVVYKGLDADTRAQLEKAVDYSKGQR